MSKYKLIDSGLQDIKIKANHSLRELDENANQIRESLRYHQKYTRIYKETLRNTNNAKRRYKRQIEKIDQIKQSLNPIPPQLRIKNTSKK